MTGVNVTLHLSDDQLDQLAERVAAKLAGRPSQPDHSQSRWLTIADAACYLACSKQRIYDLRSSGRLSRHGDGRRGLVDREELDAVVSGGA